ncbi:hypothetical protein CDIK_1929 [Cucumispora dikerogammari]|nr:hypothetical protein CDIK_1929 [Cucumispora dikerogammari]
MPLLETPDNLKDTDLIPVSNINSFLDGLYKKGKLSTRIRVTKPITLLKLRDFLREQVKANIYSEKVNPQSVKSFLNDRLKLNNVINEKQSVYNPVWVENLSVLSDRANKLHGALDFRIWTLKTIGFFTCVIFSWSFLEYKQIPV